MNMREVVFVDAARTPFCRMGGMLKEKNATDLGMIVLQALLDKSDILARGEVNAVMAGTANTDAFCRHPARYMTLGVNLPLKTSSSSIEMQDGTAIAAMNFAAYKIALGFDDVILVGGVDSWSRKPAYMKMDTKPYQLIAPAAIEHKVSPYEDEDLNTIQISDRVAKLWNISRSECDEAAAMSAEKYSAACQKGLLGSEVIPFVIPATKKAPEITVSADDVAEVSGLAAMDPFRTDGVTTAGNLAHYADGAGFVMMMSADKARELGYTPIARWVVGADVGCEPNVTAAASAHAGMKAVKSAGLQVSDIALWENNQISAAYDICARKELNRLSGGQVKLDSWNPNGGALAVGQAGAAAGVRMVCAAMQSLETTGRFACVTSGCAGGQGSSLILEKL